jgi:transcriptional regulator with XRE-family HTH domain
MKQAAVSRLENPNYGNLSVKTLKRLAEAFDVALIVRFATFGEIVDWATSLSESRLTPAEFSADRSLDIILDYTEDRILHDQIIIRDRTGAAEKQVDPVLTPSRHIEPGTASLANIA